MPELSSVRFLCLGAHVPVLHRTAATVLETNGNPAEQRIVPPGSVEGHALRDFFLGAMPSDAGTPIEVLICPFRRGLCRGQASVLCFRFFIEFTRFLFCIILLYAFCYSIFVLYLLDA